VEKISYLNIESGRLLSFLVSGIQLGNDFVGVDASVLGQGLGEALQGGGESLDGVLVEAGSSVSERGQLLDEGDFGSATSRNEPSVLKITPSEKRSTRASSTQVQGMKFQNLVFHITKLSATKNKERNLT